MFLNINNLFVNYDQLEILKGVSMEIEEGKISLLLGANGSGKSTLFKTISGLIKPKSGEIWFRNKRIDCMSTSDIVALGLAQVPEGRRVFTSLTVLQNLKMGAYLRKNNKEVERDIEAMFERFPVLKLKRNEESVAMSGGEQQILAIVRALMTRPTLLLMDEPSQGLSPVVTNEISNIITDLNKTGLTIMIIEHNLRLGLSIAHNIYVLENGKIAFKANSTDLSGMEYARRIYLGGR